LWKKGFCACGNHRLGDFSVRPEALREAFEIIKREKRKVQGSDAEGKNGVNKKEDWGSAFANLRHGEKKRDCRTLGGGGKLGGRTSRGLGAINEKQKPYRGGKPLLHSH